MSGGPPPSKRQKGDVKVNVESTHDWRKNQARIKPDKDGNRAERRAWKKLHGKKDE